MDARKPLEQLQREWSTCTRCSLGEERVTRNKDVVQGFGICRGVMFIGAGPGQDEEREGLPLRDEGGAILRGIVKTFGMEGCSYFTNALLCRACEPRLDENGLPKFSRGYPGHPKEPLFKDTPPPPPALAACLPRLQEEIYLVDPVVIVALGAEVMSLLAGKPGSITMLRGKEQTIKIPGATWKPALTEKAGKWMRKVKGEVSLPVLQNEVEYLMIPTWHPSYITKKQADQGDEGPAQQFAADIARARDIYRMYVETLKNA